MRVSPWMVIGLALLAAPAQAVPLAVQPGLWEATVEAEGGGSSALQHLLQRQIAKLKPDQQLKAQALIAAAAGIPLMQRICVTPELLRRSLSGADGKGRCSRTVISSSGTSLTLQVSCTGRDQLAGTLHLTVAGPHEVNGTIDVRLTTKDGAELPVHRAVDGHWLGTDCGGVKPLAE